MASLDTAVECQEEMLRMFTGGSGNLSNDNRPMRRHIIIIFKRVVRNALGIPRGTSKVVSYSNDLKSSKMQGKTLQQMNNEEVQGNEGVGLLSLPPSPLPLSSKAILIEAPSLGSEENLCCTWRGR